MILFRHADSARRRGSIFLVATTLVVVVMGLVVAFLAPSLARYKASERAIEGQRAFCLAEAGISAGLDDLEEGGDGNLGSADAPISFAGGEYYTVATDDGNGRVTILSVGRRGQNVCALEGVFRNLYIPLTAQGIAAIVSKGYVDLSGNITADGRDYSLDGTTVDADGLYAVVSGGDVLIGGASASGGYGTAPPGNGAGSGSSLEDYDWDANGGFPADPDAILGVTPGTLKAAAQSTGTYFDTQDGYEAAIDENDGSMLGGVIIFCEFEPSPPFELGSSINEDPSILVVHTEDFGATAKNVHGEFKGLLIADQVEHVNAGTVILGSIWCYSQAGNLFGNGNSEVHFSSAVLANLPGAGAPNDYDMLSWRKTAVPQ